MNSSLVLILLVAIASIQVNAFLPSSLKASTIFKQLSTRLQFKNFDEMLEQLEVPVLVDFYGDYSISRLFSLSTAKLVQKWLYLLLGQESLDHTRIRAVGYSNIHFAYIYAAQWCGPCQMMQPILEDVANRLENDAKVAKVDTDKAPKLGHRYQVHSIQMRLSLSTNIK